MAPIAAMVVMIGPNVRLGPSGLGPGAAAQHFSPAGPFQRTPASANLQKKSATDEMANQSPEPAHRWGPARVFSKVVAICGLRLYLTKSAPFQEIFFCPAGDFMIDY